MKTLKKRVGKSNENTQQIMMRVDKTIYTKLKFVAMMKNMTVGLLIDESINEYMDNHYSNLSVLNNLIEEFK